MIGKIDMSIEEISAHPTCSLAKSLVEQINSNITGRVCLTDHLHYMYALKQIMGERCKNYLEIGTLHGGSLCLVMQSEFGEKFCGIDIFSYYGKSEDPGSGKLVSMENTSKNVEKWNKHGHEFKLIKGSSFDAAVLAEAKNYVEPIDLLFIDGDHSYAGVVNDFNKYGPLVSPGGVVVFDNYGQVDPVGWPEVKPAVDELDKKDWRVVGQLGGPRQGYLYIMQKLG